MESTIVIKVKYEKTLRRFNANVVDGRLVLDIKALRAKVLSLFNLAPDADLTLRYTDEDGDVVTLADEEDLLDVVKQSLNPLRITVKLNTENTAKKDESGASIPSVSPGRSQPVNDILNSVVREAALKVTKVLSLMHKGSPPVLTEIVENFRKQVAEHQASAETIPKTDGASVGKDLPVNKDTKGSLKPQVVGKCSSSNSGVIRLKNYNPSAFCSKSGTTITRDQFQKAGVLDLNVKAPDAQFNWWPGVPTYLNKDINPNKYPFVPVPPVSLCPFSGDVVGNDYGYTSLPQYGPLQPQPRIFHYGVECDGCGVQPIEGIRFKSKVKNDYDLCNNCFAKEGNQSDYMRIPTPAHQFPRLHSRRKPHFPTGGTGTKGGDLKLDSCFIQDVNILDGTIVSPSTPFTKIWRMKNNGTTVWPCGTHLIWIGGDKFANTVSVELEIPDTGLTMEGELDVAVEFCAPELPGRYISYWRLASPSGQKFGQRVWVLIQVDASLSVPLLQKDTQLQNTHRFNLNFPPPISTSLSSTQISNAAGEDPMVNYKNPNAMPERPNKDKELLEPLVEVYTNKDEELNFPINDTLLVGGAVNPPSPAVASSSTVSYPVIDLSTTEPVAHYTIPVTTNSAAPLIPADTTTIPAKIVGGAENDVERKLLRELEEMGFKEIDLNKDILRKNEYDLQSSVDDLCGVEEWDPILDELKEMGFCNYEVNKRLLKKNNGSIKRVVMDLINGE